MVCNAYCARRTISTIALVAGGCLVTTGTTAEPAAGQSGWFTQVSPAARLGAAVDANAEKQAAALEASSEKKAADNTQEPAPSKGSSEVRKTAKASSEHPKQRKAAQDDFRPDPQYEAKYDAEGQADIYGGKSEVDPPRPLLELGRQQYTSGIYDESSTLLGQLNPLLPGLAVYGDWRTAVAYNNNNGKDIAQIATRLNIDVDLKITGTERIHAFFTPIQENNNKFTRFEFAGDDADGDFTGQFDAEPQTLFFEGDAGSLYSGFSGREASFDLPFTVGLFPLFLQNGIWANDAILGGAVTLPAKNSAAMGIPNFDVTVFAAFDNVDNAGIIGADDRDNHVANLYGVTAFIDAFDGYIETGYGFIEGREEQDGLRTHFLTAAYSRRYYHTVSNSTRLFANFGEDPEGESDGVALISENSLISGLPSTLLPYANFFVGFGNPQPLVDGNGAGILKNVGINFETDALTGYPKLDDTGSNALGGALGLQYLFNLDQQLVFEVAMVQPFDNDGIGAQDPQYGFGVRYQIPIDRAWLFRADATYQILEDAEEDNFGVRAEVRRKF
jgi:hypothetical protein